MNTKIVKSDATPTINPYHQDTGQLTKTALEFDPRNDAVYVYQDYEMDSTTVDIYNNRVLYYRFDFIPDATELNDYLTSSDFLKKTAKISENFRVNWNGNNLVGEMPREIWDIWEDICNDLDAVPETTVSYLRVQDFASSSDIDIMIDIDIDDDKIRRLAAQIADLAMDCGVELLDDPEMWVRKQLV